MTTRKHSVTALNSQSHLQVCSPTCPHIRDVVSSGHSLGSPVKQPPEYSRAYNQAFTICLVDEISHEEKVKDDIKEIRSATFT
ncbi:hypothetical protein PoB_003735800 [Plakobranchus ocellatus]|uniref:Uncharacterized protein n=1 Tax=Plakobranchus ocellatus TaxID=259542 RepID=A0AAV4ATY2_9GAST|nr:hypothetical protein PoB_003735800 [Plakobranchus ocellatus]